ncbi:hypothetical protein M422DRAFT_275399 [Sphaerobolus stellatus SS14]|uniref:Uncharacterized protein n=1 Tax=Sphaerobolus stellatus (strain SS14) TaxID=990650 RepID=A0A0C9T529_SPHS4|nr:hypothetical protein M422DRAFT_275399 [Sphaerobolus stellatus SS14]
MIQAQDDAQSASFHPFWYARLIGIYHVNVEYYYGLVEIPSIVVGPNTVGFVHDEDDTDSFGFLDPAPVIQAVHLISAFNEGRIKELLGDSVARRYNKLKDDWQFFYVNSTSENVLLAEDFELVEDEAEELSEEEDTEDEELIDNKEEADCQGTPPDFRPEPFRLELSLASSTL